MIGTGFCTHLINSHIEDLDGWERGNGRFEEEDKPRNRRALSSLSTFLCTLLYLGNLALPPSEPFHRHFDKDRGWACTNVV